MLVLASLTVIGKSSDVPLGLKFMKVPVPTPVTVPVAARKFER
jgi:hypothetical protein